MVEKKDFRRVDKFIWELPKETRPDMRVPARIFASAEMLDSAFRDRTVEQLINTATLPGILKYAMASAPVSAARTSAPNGKRPPRSSSTSAGSPTFRSTA